MSDWLSTYSCLHARTGDMLRAAMAAKSPLGLQVEGAMNRGEVRAGNMMNASLSSLLHHTHCRAFTTPSDTCCS